MRSITYKERVEMLIDEINFLPMNRESREILLGLLGEGSGGIEKIIRIDTTLSGDTEFRYVRLSEVSEDESRVVTIVIVRPLGIDTVEIIPTMSLYGLYRRTYLLSAAKKYKVFLCKETKKIDSATVLSSRQQNKLIRSQMNFISVNKESRNLILGLLTSRQPGIKNILAVESKLLNKVDTHSLKLSESEPEVISIEIGSPLGTDTIKVISNLSIGALWGKFKKMEVAQNYDISICRETLERSTSP